MKTYSLKFGIYFVEHSLRNPEHMSRLPSTLVGPGGPGGRKELFTAHSSGMGGVCGDVCPGKCLWTELTHWSSSKRVNNSKVSAEGEKCT